MASILKVDEIQPKTSGGNIKISTQDRVMFGGGLTANQSGTRLTEEQVVNMTANEIDTHNAFDGDAFTVPTGGAGKYLVNFNVQADYDGIGDDGEVTYCTIKVNGTRKMVSSVAHKSTGEMKMVTVNATALLDLSVGDVVTFWVYGHATSGNHTITHGNGTYPYTMVHGYQLA